MPAVCRFALPLLFLCALLTACGGGGGGGVAAPPPAAPSPSVPVVAPPATPAPISTDIALLMMGNSHTSTNNLPDMLASMLRAGRPGKTVAIVVAPQWGFLDEHLRSASTRQLFNSKAWSAVVFQAQKYSTSGLYEYSTSEAVEWVRMTRARNMVPVMFPEWPRFETTEAQFIYDLHTGIAKQQAACVAPIPQSFDLALLRAPDIVLHSADGNHAAAPGSFLAALILYATLTGNAPAGLPYLADVAVDGPVQARLRAVAEETVARVAPRLWCPDDVRL